MADPTKQEETEAETRTIRVLVAVGGRSFSWQPGDEIELPTEQAALWADGRRAVYADGEDATNPPPQPPTGEPGGEKPDGDPGGEQHTGTPPIEEPSQPTPPSADDVVEPSEPTPATEDEVVEPSVEAPDAASINAAGGGWYEIVVDGKVVDKVRGEEAAQARLAELQASAE